MAPIGFFIIVVLISLFGYKIYHKVPKKRRNKRFPSETRAPEILPTEAPPALPPRIRLPDFSKALRAGTSVKRKVLGVSSQFRKRLSKIYEPNEREMVQTTKAHRKAPPPPPPTDKLYQDSIYSNLVSHL